MEKEIASVETFRILNDYSSSLPKNIRRNVKKEKIEILTELKKEVFTKKKTVHNVMNVIKLFNIYETISTQKYKLFHLYIFMLTYLWWFIPNEEVNINTKSYICQVITNIVKNVKKYILSDFFFAYDMNLIKKDEELPEYQELTVYIASDVLEGESDPNETDHSYVSMDNEYFMEYQTKESTVSEDSDGSNVGELISMSDDYYISLNGIFEKHDTVPIPIDAEPIMIDGKDERFRLYIQNRIMSILDYKYLLDCINKYFNNEVEPFDDCSHNVYKTYASSVLQLLMQLRNFCFYRTEEQEVLMQFAMSNRLAEKYEQSVLRPIQENVDLETQEICTRYGSIFLNLVLLGKLSSDDLCFHLLIERKLLLLYTKIRRYTWHSINYAFAKIMYKGLRYAYTHDIAIPNEISEVLSTLYFLFLFYVKLPISMSVNPMKYFIPEEYGLLLNENDSIVKVISKIFVLLLNENYRGIGGSTSGTAHSSTVSSAYMTIEQFLKKVEEKEFDLSKLNAKEELCEIFPPMDVYEFITVISSLFMPYIHPSSVGKHPANINLFINCFLFYYLRKTIRERNMKERAKNENHICPQSFYFFTEQDRAFVVKHFLKLIVQGMFPKTSKGMSLFESMLKHICAIDINCLDVFMPNMLDALSNVNTSTQASNCILALCLLIPLLVKYKPVYLKQIIHVMNTGLDVCDVLKSFIIFSFLSILFSCITIVNVDKVDYERAVAEYRKCIGYDIIQKEWTDEEIIEILKQRKEVSDYLNIWVLEFFDNILYFIKYSKSDKNKDTKKNNTESKHSKMETDIYTGVRTTLVSLFVHLDNELVLSLCKRFLSHMDLENGKYLAVIPYAVGLVNNQEAFDLLFNFFYKKLVSKKKAKRPNLVGVTDGINGEVTTEAEPGLDQWVYTKNEYINDEQAKCYLLFLASLIRKCKSSFINEKDICELIRIYIVDSSNSIFKYVCKIIYRYLECNFNLVIRDYSCFNMNDLMSGKDREICLAHWGLPWHIIKRQSKAVSERCVSTNRTQERNENQLRNFHSLLEWDCPSLEEIRKGKKLIFFLLDAMIDLMNKCNVPIECVNLKKYIDKNKETMMSLEWKFQMNYVNVLIRYYRLTKSIMKPLSSLYPDERYQYDRLLTKCHVVDTQLVFYMYVYLSEIIISFSLNVLNIPKEVLDLSVYINSPEDQDKDSLVRKQSSQQTESVNENGTIMLNDTNNNIPSPNPTPSPSPSPSPSPRAEGENNEEQNEENKIQKLRNDFFNNVINKKGVDVKTDAKLQRKIIKHIQWLLIKSKEGNTSCIYNDYVNTMLSFTYSIYPNSFNYDVVKNQYVNNVFFFFNERLKYRKRNYSFSGYRKQLCNILFYTNLSIYSQVRLYAQATIKTILPSFKGVKGTFLKICFFYMRNYVKLYALKKKESMQESKTTSLENGERESTPENEEGGREREGGERTNHIERAGSSNDTKTVTAETSWESFFENKCISCFNGILNSLSNSMGVIKKIASDVYFLKKFIRMIISVLKLEIQKEDITGKCMKLVYTVINNRSIKNWKEKKNVKKMKNIYELLKAQSQKKNNVYVQVVVLSFLICFTDIIMVDNEQEYFMILLENLSIEKNVHVYNLAFCAFIRFLKGIMRFQVHIPLYLKEEFSKLSLYKNVIDICWYKNFKSKKKSNSITAIILNLSKYYKTFKGFIQIGEGYSRDFTSYQTFFKFLVKLQNDKKQPIQPNPEELSSANDPKWTPLRQVLYLISNFQKSEQEDLDMKGTFISIVIPILFSLRKLQDEEEREFMIEEIIALLEKDIGIVNNEVFPVWIFNFSLFFINLKKKYVHIYSKLYSFCLSCNFLDVSNLVLKKKMQLLNIMVTYTMHKDHSLLDRQLFVFLELMDNENMTVRQGIGDILGNILYVVYDFEKDNHLKNMFYHVLVYLTNRCLQVIQYFKNNETISKQCSSVYALETFAYLTLTVYNNKCMYVLNNLSILLLKMFILSVKLVDPYLNDLTLKASKCFACPSLYLLRNRHLRDHSIIRDLDNLSLIMKEEEENKTEEESSFPKQEITAFADLIKEPLEQLLVSHLSEVLTNPNFKVRNEALQFCFMFYSYYSLFYYSSKEHSFFVFVFLSLLTDSYLELQMIARNILSSVFCYFDSMVVQKMSEYFMSLLNLKKGSFGNVRELTGNKVDVPENVVSSEIVSEDKLIERKKTMGLYLLICVVNSFPNLVPTWLPKVLVHVAKASNVVPPMLKKEIERCIQNFLRMHKDEWDYKYRHIFTDEELNILDLYKGGLNYFT